MNRMQHGRIKEDTQNFSWSVGGAANVEAWIVANIIP